MQSFVIDGNKLLAYWGMGSLRTKRCQGPASRKQFIKATLIFENHAFLEQSAAFFSPTFQTSNRYHFSASAATLGVLVRTFHLMPGDQGTQGTGTHLNRRHG